MFGNNINSSFMSPNMTYGPVPMINTTTPSMIGMYGPRIVGRTPKSGGFLSSLLGGNQNGNILSKASKINFGNILNNTSKALNVVKEAIPIVKEVGPMMGNMKSILKIASAFKDETEPNTRNTNTTNNTTINNESDTRTTSTTTNPKTNENEPNFFL